MNAEVQSRQVIGDVLARAKSEKEEAIKIYGDVKCPDCGNDLFPIAVGRDWEGWCLDCDFKGKLSGDSYKDWALDTSSDEEETFKCFLRLK